MRLLLILAASVLAAQPIVRPGPSQQPAFHDDLLEQFVGFWDVTGAVQGQPVHAHTAVEWTLNHQFLRIHRKEVDGPHESLMYIGYDTVSERYVAHELDTYGGRGSETLGYGIRSGDKIQFVFEYPSGPYHYTMSWDGKEKGWQLVLESKNRQGSWTTFSTQTLRRIRGRGPSQ